MGFKEEEEREDIVGKGREYENVGDQRKLILVLVLHVEKGEEGSTGSTSF